MHVRRTGLAAATLLLAAVTAAAPSAQPGPTPDTPKEMPRDPRPDGPFGARPGGLSPEVRARLFDGRMAMIKGALRLDEAQLKLWAPVEAQLRASFAARQGARTEREEMRRQGGERPSIAERLDRRSKRLVERAERAKALAEAFRPFHASLGDEQRAVARLVLRPVFRGPHGWRWHRRDSDDD